MTEKTRRNDMCWCGSCKKYKDCHYEIDNKIRLFQQQGHRTPPKAILKTPKQIAAIRESGQINIAVLDAVAEYIKVGVSTEDIDRLVCEITKELGGVPAQLGYNGFPKSVCTSLNNEVCHGIPSKDVILKEGDIINVDASTVYNGYFSDSSRMFSIGAVHDEKRRLVRIARECIDLGLEKVRPWGFLGDIGQAVQDHARRNGYTVVRDIGGHGIGLEFHEDPWVSFVSKENTEMLMVPGMIFTIEPMINMGTDKVFLDEKNGWTVYTDDGLSSAQWEVMVLVTEEGHEVLAY